MIRALLLLPLALWGTPEASVASDSLIPFGKNSILTGTVSAEEECDPSDRRNPQVWVSIGQILLYQVEVPVNGSYEFHLVPGKYDLLATNAKGCMSETQLTVKPMQVARKDLRLTPARKPASLSEKKGEEKER